MAIDQLLVGEKVLESFAGSNITLTNKRIRYKKGTLGESHVVSILLRNISSIEIASKSYPIYLLLGGLSMLLTLGYSSFLESLEIGVFGVLFSTTPFIIYWLKQKRMLLIYPHGGTPIALKNSGIETSRLVDLVNKIEEALIDIEHLK